MKLLKSLGFLLMVSLLAACGGGGGSAGTPIVGGPGANPTAAELVIVLSANTVASSGQETVTATVTALDASRNAVAGVPVAFAVNANGIVTPSGTSTNAQGVITATVGIGSDTSARAITVTATSGALTRTATLTVLAQGTTGAPSIDMVLSSTSVSAATPATATTTLRDTNGRPVAGQVVTFSVVRGIAITNVGTALTDGAGTAAVVLSPRNASSAGADELVASASIAGTVVSVTRGFQVQATNVSIEGFTSAVSSLSAYGQTALTVTLRGASVGAPVQLGVTSACASQNKAAVSPETFTATTASVTLQYRDLGCGAVQTADQLQVTIAGTAISRALSLPLSAPTVSSVAFIQAQPETIFLRGSGFAESSTVTFEVRDAAGNPLPNRNVVARLLTLTGGVTMEGGTADVVRTSDARGRVALRVNSGTLPTPVRISATLEGTAISTVSSNLSVAIGLPSQLNFSLSQGAINIEGYNIDGTTNTYQVIAADRSGNPVPSGTSINYVTEGGQVEAVRQIAIVNGIARTVANFVSSEPRPLDGRVTVTAYALGEESFLDLNGNNVYDLGEPYQDLGNIFRDRLFDGLYDGTADEIVPLAVNNANACTPPGDPLMRLDPSIPSQPSTCDGRWSGAGQVYVRRSVETVLSTSAARPLWADTRNLTSSCQKLTLQIGPQPTSIAVFTRVAGDTYYGGRVGTMALIAADANPGRADPVTGRFDPANGYNFPRLNPMARGTTISAATTTGMRASVGGSPVANSSEATAAAVTYEFVDPLVSSGVVTVSFTSPGGLTTSYSINVIAGARPAEVGTCP